MKTPDQNEPTWVGTCHHPQALYDMIGALPDTIRGVKVPRSLDHFNPAGSEVKPSTAAWRESITEMVRTTLLLPGGDEIDQFSLCSYYGGAGTTAPYYIQLSSPASRDFARRMSAGEFGRLD